MRIVFLDFAGGTRNVSLAVIRTEPTAHNRRTAEHFHGRVAPYLEAAMRRPDGVPAIRK